MVYKGWWESRQGVRHQTTSQNKRSPCVSVCPVADPRAPHSSSSREESEARRPVTGTTCHQLHRSTNGPPLDQRHGRQCVAPPRRQFTLHSHTHTHAYINIHARTNTLLPTPIHLQASTGETRRPPYENMQGCWR